MKLILLRIVNSHRGRDKAWSLLGFRPKTYYRKAGREGEFIFAPEDKAALLCSTPARGRTGSTMLATRSKVNHEEIAPCWPSDDARFSPTQPYNSPNYTAHLPPEENEH